MLSLSEQYWFFSANYCDIACVLVPCARVENSGIVEVRRFLCTQGNTMLSAMATALRLTTPHNPESSGARYAVISRLAAAIGKESRTGIIYYLLRMTPDPVRLLEIQSSESLFYWYLLV
jgi:hypothetical protein